MMLSLCFLLFLSSVLAHPDNQLGGQKQGNFLASILLKWLLLLILILILILILLLPLYFFLRPFLSSRNPSIVHFSLALWFADSGAGFHIFEGDMMLPVEAIKKIESGEGLSDNTRGASKYSGRWPGGVVPYEIHGSICEYECSYA